MIAASRFPLAGGLVLIGLAAVASAQDFRRSPNEIGGVGAQGEIGRGVSPGERPAAWGPISVEVAPVSAETPAAVPAVSVAVQPSAANAVESPTTVAGPPPISEPALVRYNPYMGAHRSWLHGYWSKAAGGSMNGESAAPAGPGAGSSDRQATAQPGATNPVPQPGMGRGWGLPGWLVGPMVYRWGYLAYANPYDGGRPPRGDAGSEAPDYSRPVDVLAAPPTETLMNDALEHFAEAREAFRREDYPRALVLIDESLALMPNDPGIHGLRALTLMALTRYREAAAAYHAVIAVVPGWDWTTMLRLYDKPRTYTDQLRRLESYSRDHPQSPEAHFLCAIQYLTTGYSEAAAAQLHELVELQPGDLLAGELLGLLQPTGGIAPVTPAAGPARTPEGSWVARPRKDTTIRLSFQIRGRLEVRIRRPGEEAVYGGFYRHDRGVLVLTQDQDNTMTVKLTWTDPRHFRIDLAEGGPDDPGLSFEKSP